MGSTPNASSLDGTPFTSPAWEQAGGADTMRRIVDLFVDRAVADPCVNYDRCGRYPQDLDTIARTKKLALDFLSCAIGGPLKYNGRSLSEIHQPMAINSDEFDAFVSHFHDAMCESGLSQPVISQLMVAIDGVRPSILGSG